MSNCKSCGKAIRWEQTEKGRWTPMNLNGTSHFQTCPQRKQWKGWKSTEETGIDYTKYFRDPKQKGLEEF